MVTESEQRLGAWPWFVAVGASGSEGLGDLKTLLSALPANLDAVVMVVLHRAFDRPSHLREVLARVTDLEVVVAEEGERFLPGHCYIGEPAAHLTLAARSFGDLVEDPGRVHRNRTVDLLFKSIALHAGPNSVGIILSGSLDDGARGVAAIHAAGGKTMVIAPNAQRPGGMTENGMPENAIRYDGPIDYIGSPQDIAEAIIRLVG